MDANKKNREFISALSDDALPEIDQELAMAALDSPDGREAWELYHHIGDILRAEATPDLSPGFSERLAAHLAAEPSPGKRSVTATEAADTAPVAVGPR